MDVNIAPINNLTMGGGVENIGNSHYTGIAPATQARRIVLLLLARLDAATKHIEALSLAFQCEDVGSALKINMKLQKAWSDAYVAILVLEQLSGCPETNARNALTQSHRRGRVPLDLAWNIISRLPSEQCNPNPESANAEYH